MSDSTDRNEAAAQAPSSGGTLQVVDIARILFFIFLVLFAVSLIAHLLRGRGVPPPPV